MLLNDKRNNDLAMKQPDTNMENCESIMLSLSQQNEK